MLSMLAILKLKRAPIVNANFMGQMNEIKLGGVSLPLTGLPLE